MRREAYENIYFTAHEGENGTGNLIKGMDNENCLSNYFMGCLIRMDSKLLDFSQKRKIYSGLDRVGSRSNMYAVGRRCIT